MDFIIVAQFTNQTLYEKEVKRLIKSLHRFGLGYDIESIADRGSWMQNLQDLPHFIKRMLDKHRRPVVYVDCDAVVKQYPQLFLSLTADIGVHYRNGVELLGGTIYFNDSPGARKIIDEWVLQAQDRTLKNIQVPLARALLKLKNEVSVYRLPATYCQIFDLMRDSGEPVILHLQASRRYKYGYGFIVPRGQGLRKRLNYLFLFLRQPEISLQIKTSSLINYGKIVLKKYLSRFF